MRISDWSSDVCSSDLGAHQRPERLCAGGPGRAGLCRALGCGARRHHGRHGGGAAERAGLSRRAGDALVNAYPLPYSWARAQRAVLLLRPGASQLTTSARTPAWAVREILRCHGDVPVAEVSDDALETLLNAAYSDTADAASVMGVAENEIDLDRLLQDIHEVADLLETQDEAPVIRMINALFT